MGDHLKLIWCAVAGLFRSRAALQTEVLALRHQLNVLRGRTPKGIAVSNIDRLVFAGLYHLAPEVLDAVRILKRETIIRWHRAWPSAASCASARIAIILRSSLSADSGWRASSSSLLCRTSSSSDAAICCLTIFGMNSSRIFPIFSPREKKGWEHAAGIAAPLPPMRRARPNVLMFGGWAWIDQPAEAQEHELAGWLRMLIRTKSRLTVVEPGGPQPQRVCMPARLHHNRGSRAWVAPDARWSLRHASRCGSRRGPPWRRWRG
jgi:hypothetical protein